MAAVFLNGRIIYELCQLPEKAYTYRKVIVGSAIAQVVRRRPLTTEARVRALVCPCAICGGQSGAGTSSYPSSSVLPCQYHPIMDLHVQISPRR
jgi:hypothetical protein